MGILNQLVGRVVGKITVHERSKDNKYQVLASCDCNPSKKYYTNGYGIAYEKTKSCGCLQQNQSVLNEIVGDTIGRLTVHKKCEDGIVIVSCSCSPTVQYKTNGYSIRDGRTLSCGCWKSDITVNRNIDNTKHGLSGTKIYDVWRQMIDRCHNDKNKDYNHYGGRGIIVEDDWHNVLTFKEWADSNGYVENRNLSIDRINTNGNYSSDNCHWITISENIGKRNTEYAKNKK